MSAQSQIYDQPQAIEPLLPAEGEQLQQLALTLVQHSARLGNCLHPITRGSIAQLVRSMNSYYSNLIEGHNTHPADIERALRQDFSLDPATRALQLESKAHIEVQLLLEERLSASDPPIICSADFLCWIHKEFYDRLPLEFRRVRTKGGNADEVQPGNFRHAIVEVGRHVAPHWKALPLFFARFKEAYDPDSLSALQRVIAAAASHHRLAWIHPFLDGNGRVTRLFTHAYLARIGLNAGGLWTISRGLARRKDVYLQQLSSADSLRRNDYDGRGNLSHSALVEFCRFFLETCIDQIGFMYSLLDLDSAQRRIQAFAERWAAEHKMPREIAFLLRDCFLRGELTRTEAMHSLGKPERTARRLLHALISQNLLLSQGPGKPVRIAFPIFAVGYYFPRLFPEGVELSEGH